jgi:two-component system, NarL family, nitrate/nitrite response regulator NarL
VALRLLIVDDQTGFCEAARDLLEGQGITVLGCASSIEDALSSIGSLQPDVVLVDIDLGSESGFDLTQRIAVRDASTPKVILTSTHDEREFHKLIESSPAVGFLAKTELSAARISGLLEAQS